MAALEQAERCAEAANEFNRSESRSDGAQIVESLTAGFRVLSDSTFTRIHFDVEQQIGLDSMLIPGPKAEAKARAEINLFQIVESALHAEQHGYVSTGSDWYVKWLGTIALGEAIRSEKAAERIASYIKRSETERQQMFSNLLGRVFPEARRAPLVLYRLLPPAIQIVTSLAFGDHPPAEDARRKQKDALMAIGDCSACNGKLLENGDRCRECGNPLWKYNWLMAD